MKFKVEIQNWSFLIKIKIFRFGKCYVWIRSGLGYKYISKKGEIVDISVIILNNKKIYWEIIKTLVTCIISKNGE